MLDEIRDPSNRDHAPLGIRKVDMISCNLLSVPRVFFYALVVINALKCHLAEAIEFGQVDHVLIEELSHKTTSLSRVVKLFGICSIRPTTTCLGFLTIVH